MTPTQKQQLDQALAAYGCAIDLGNYIEAHGHADRIDAIVSRMRERTDIHHQILLQMLSVCLDESATVPQVAATTHWLDTMETDDLDPLPEPRHWRTIL